jgi:hypothetical protein
VHKKFSAALGSAFAMTSYPHLYLTLNVILYFCAASVRPLAELPILHARPPADGYSSSMCSNFWTAADAGAQSADLAEQLATAIEECAAAVSSQEGAAAGELAARLAAAWAMLTRADPEVAARMARYCDG